MPLDKNPESLHLILSSFAMLRIVLLENSPQLAQPND
jgi:hypothetical protein